MMKKIIVFITLAMLIMSGCNMRKSPENTPSPTPSPSASATPQMQTPPPEPAGEVDKLTMTAIYGGRADYNFIEVILNDGSFETLKLSEELCENLENMDVCEDDKIEITYTAENGVKTVVDIKKK